MSDPFQTYRFLVTLDTATGYLPGGQARLLPFVVAGAFQEVSGIGAELEVMPHKEGGINDYVHQLPVRHSWSRITLKKGVVTEDFEQQNGLWHWYQTGLTQSLGARRDGAIILLSPDGRPQAAWDFRAGIAAKWTGPTMNAMQNEVAIESLEIAHHGVLQVLQSQVG